MTKTAQLKTRMVDGFENYNVERELNAGNFARVYKVRELATGKRYAAKFIEKSRLSPVDLENVKREVGGLFFFTFFLFFLFLFEFVVVSDGGNSVQVRAKNRRQKCV